MKIVKASGELTVDRIDWWEGERERDREKEKLLHGYSHIGHH